MKTIFFTIAAFLISVCVFSYNDENTVVYTNVDGNKKECTIIDKNTSRPLKKTVYENNTQGQRVAKIDYIWDSNNGWVNESKTSYNYDINNNVSVAYHKWDTVKKEWIIQQ